MASVDINIVGATPPFNFSVKDESQVERFLSYNNGKIYFSDIQDSTNHTYTVTVSKGNCVINNELLLYNCGSSTPTPISPESCIAPIISLVSVNNNTVTIGINTASSNCSSYQFQYSNFIDFTTFNSINTTCNTQQYIDVPTVGTWYFRILKTCNNQSSIYSNIITAQINQSTPIPVTTCASCKYYNIYSAFSSWQVNYLDCNNVPSTIYGIAGSNTTVQACENSLNEVYGNVIITDLGNSNPPIPIPVPIASNDCVGVSFTITLSDLQSADGSVVFVEYTDCFGTLRNENYSNPSTYTGGCMISTSTVEIYRYVSGIKSTGTSTYNILSQC